MGLHPAIEGSLNGKTILWGAPTIEQSRIGWGELQKACGGIYTFLEARREAVSPTGGRVIFKTLDEPDNARGFTLDDVVAQLQRAWSLRAGPTRYPVLLELPSITG